VIAAVLLIPYYALFTYEFLYVAPEQGITFAVEFPRETAEQRWDLVLRVVKGIPFMLGAIFLVVFVVLAAFTLLGRIVRRRFLLPYRR
jgi:hypothetical protein